MIVLKPVILFGLALAVRQLAAERPLSSRADIDPPQIAPELFSEELPIAPFQEVDESYRLPKTTSPIHYSIQLRTEVHTGERNFEGTVAITLNVKETTNEIVVHHRGLTVQSAQLKSVPENGNEVQFPDPTWAYDAALEQLTFTSENPLEPGNYLLTVRFIGRLGINEDGFYRSSYTDAAGTKKYLATTQFESTSARTAFPCYDEPGLKATFELKIVHHNSYSARSNMRPISSEPAVGENVLTIFETTKLMSSYLLAFVVSDFESKGDNLQSIYARPNAIEETDFALEAGGKILTALSSHIGISYYDSMPEMKQFAIPDFAAGAMENWGLVTYREQYLLFDPAISTYRTKTNIATVIAHEYAHQWFGNLVSPEWWEYIWLNEGFATLYEYYGAHLAYPDEGYWELFNPFVIQAALIPDGLDTTRPMTWNAATPSEISRLFDRVAYAKSGSVLNMMRHVLGEENWVAGLKAYLTDRSYAGANVEHLHTGLQTAIAGKNVLPEGVTIKQIMDSWTTEKGYPVVSVRRTYATGDVIISQERFVSDRKVPNTNVWMIPYNFVHKSSADFSDISSYDWLSTKAARLKLEVPANDWLIFNRQQVGFYRVNYDDENWKLIIEALKNDYTSIHYLNRAQLIDDAYWLARSGRLDIEILMDLLTYLEHEDAFAPWVAASNVFTYLNTKFRATAAENDLLVMIKHLIAKVYATFKVAEVPTSEKLLDKYLKQSISTWACMAGVEDCLSKTAAALTNEAVNGVRVHPDIATVVYCYGLQSAGETEFVYLYNQIYPSQNWAYRSMLINSLGCSKNEVFLKDFLSTAIGSAEINYKSSERTQVVQSVYSGGRAGVNALIDFLMNTNNAREFVSVLGINTLNSALTNIASRTTTEEEAQKLEELITNLELYVTDSVAESARSTVKSNQEWQDSYESLLVSNYVKDYADALDDTTTTVTDGPTPTPTGDVTTVDPATTTPEPDSAASTAISISVLITSVMIALFR
ncbi:aminopeptidase N-like [Wyeomyia smithii]|uniref:aminopeptidase N-like n=1 Tax=Wyeomyia smithii TaxID=174621 RepID=UPI002467F2C0|nr:aminopeptidase N-like [Wyeomyia smithii]XP_055548791.1 aminopeptidase N-like [Wyeomyia smithii]